MNIQDIRSKTNEEIAQEIKNCKREQLNIRFQRAAGEFANTSRVRVLRKSIARLKTVVSERKKTS